MKLNVQLICNDIDLYNIFISSGLFNNVAIGGDINFSTKYENLIISDRIIKYNDLLNYLNENKLKADKVFYLISYTQNESQINSVTYVLKAKNICVIPPKLTEKQILERVCKELSIDKHSISNVITFFGADSKVGTTITAQAVAEILAENTSLKVGFLNLSGQPSFNYLPESEGFGLDIIKTKIFNSVLSADELKSAMVQKDKLYVLPSVRTLTDLRFYKPKHVEYLINIATSIFDVVIVDAGYYPNSGLYIGAINASGIRYMVATQQETCRAAFDITREQLFKVHQIGTESIMLVVNRYSEDIDLPNPYKLADEVYKMVLSASLPNVQGAFWKTETEKRTLRGLDPYYDAEINNLVSVIAGQLNIELKQDNVRKHKNIFSKIASLINSNTRRQSNVS